MRSSSFLPGSARAVLFSELLCTNTWRVLTVTWLSSPEFITRRSFRQSPEFYLAASHNILRGCGDERVARHGVKDGVSYGVFRTRKLSVRHVVFSQLFVRWPEWVHSYLPFHDPPVFPEVRYSARQASFHSVRGVLSTKQEVVQSSRILCVCNTKGLGDTARQWTFRSPTPPKAHRPWFLPSRIPV